MTGCPVAAINHPVAVLAAKALVLSGSTVTAQVIMRLYGAEALGHFAVSLAVILLLAIVYQRGALQSFVRFCVRHPDVRLQDAYAAAQRDLLFDRRRHWLLLAGLAAAGLYLHMVLPPVGWMVFLSLLPVVALLPLMQLTGQYFKLAGAPFASSLTDLGGLYWIISLLVVLPLRQGDFHVHLALFGGAATVALVWWVARVWHEGETIPYDNTRDQWHVFLNDILLYLSRNGYSLFLAAFIPVAAIGQFRLEERLVYVLMFIYFFFDTILARRLLAGLREATRAATGRQYLLMSALIVPTTILIASALAIAVTHQYVRELLTISEEGRLQWLMFMAMPFHVLNAINMLFINLTARPLLNVPATAATLAVFVALAFVLYPVYQLDGLRLSFFFGSLIGAVMTSVIFCWFHAAKRKADVD